MEFEENKTLEIEEEAKADAAASIDPMDAIAKETIEEVEKTETPFDDMIKEEQRKAAAPKAQYAPAFKPIVINGAVFKPLANPGPQPVVAPTAHVQLTPIIVPVAIVPFATQNQPVMQYEDKKSQPQPQPQVEEPEEEVVVQDEEPAVEPEVSDEYVEETVADVAAVPEYYAPAEAAPVVSVVDSKEAPSVVSKTNGKTSKCGGRNAIMAIILLMVLIPTILGALIGQNIIPGDAKLVELGNTKIVLSDFVTETDVIGEIISYAKAGNLVEGLTADIGLVIHAVVILAVIVCFFICFIGIFVGNEIKTGIMGLILFVLSFVLFAWVAVLQSILIDGAGFSINSITAKLSSLIGYIRILLSCIIVWIVGSLVKIKKPKTKKSKKAKA